MPTITDQAICIRHWDFSETSQTVSLLAREHGLFRGLAKGAKRPRGPFSGGIDLLTRGEVVAIIKPSRALATITAWHLERVHFSIRRDLAANRAGLYMADLTQRMVTEHDPHPTLFDGLRRALEQLDDGGSREGVLLGFQWHLLGEVGYRPELSRDASTGGPLAEDGDTLAFSARDGGIVADTGAPGRWRVRRETVELLRHVASNHEVGATEDAAVVARANRLLATYVRELIGEHPSAMRWAFPDLP